MRSPLSMLFLIGGLIILVIGLYLSFSSTGSDVGFTPGKYGSYPIPNSNGGKVAIIMGTLLLAGVLVMEIRERVFAEKWQGEENERKKKELKEFWIKGKRVKRKF